MCVTKGRVIFDLGDGTSVEAKAGETVVVEKGTRFQPIFPEAGAEYIPVCLPAFKPERCIREEEGVSDVAKKLADLHGSPDAPPAAPPAEVLYHMCEKALWEAAKAAGGAYFPPTFAQDGFTHATAVPSRLVTTANHFYQDSVGDWVCLQFKRSTLLKTCGIVTRDAVSAGRRRGVWRSFVGAWMVARGAVGQREANGVGGLRDGRAVCAELNGADRAAADRQARTHRDPRYGRAGERHLQAAVASLGGNGG